MHSNRIVWTRIIAAAVFATGASLHAADAKPGVVSHVKVVSDKIEDVSSLEAWRTSFIKDGMTDQEKALSVWETVVKFRHQDDPPSEALDNEENVHDPIKCFNVYGYGMCCCASANIEALARFAGLNARGWAITLHSVPEVFWDDSWHLLDASMITYYRDGGGKIMSVEEISKSVAAWLDKNAEYRGNDKKMMQFMGNNGWKKGPEAFANSAFYDDGGFLPAGTHGWHSNIVEYGKPARNFPYEYGTAVGYEVNVQLRPGERLVRNWSNKGLHVNMEGGGAPGSLKGVPGKNDMRYAPKFGDIAPGRIGNGTFEYDVPLADGTFRTGALEAANLACKAEDQQGPAMHVKAAEQPGVLVIRMPSSYVYLGGQAGLKAAVGEGGEIAVALSDNNGLDWKDVAKITASGEQKLDLKPLIFRKYDYRVKFTMKGKGTGLDSLVLSNDIQHSQRVMPALDKGSNTITFAAGAQEGTIAIQGQMSLDRKDKGKNLAYTDFHPVLNGMQKNRLFMESGKADVTFPIATPGDMTRIRIGAHYRLRDKRDGFDVELSFDNGQTFKKVDRLEGPVVGMSRYIVCSDIPKGTKAALVRFTGQQANTAGFFDLRISADYAEPAGGFAPVKVTYVWDENGAEKRDVHVARQAQETYKIDCAAKPALKSMVVELE